MHATTVLSLELPAFTAGRPAAEVDAALRSALAACDRARECAVLWFAEVQRRELYRALGHPSLLCYAREALGFTDNRTWQFKRLADDLDRLPALREAVADGTLGWTKAQQVARIATPASEAQWVARASDCGRRELEREVQAARGVARRQARSAAGAGAQLEMGGALAPAQVVGGAVVDAAVVGVSPLDDHTGVPCTITLRGDALQAARFEVLLEKVRKLRAVPAGADRLDAVLAGLEALVAGTAVVEDASTVRERREAAPAYQIVVQQCPDCAAATVATGSGDRRIAPAQAAAVACDARVREPGKPNRATIAPSVRAKVLARDRHRCTMPGCGSPRFLEVHHVVARQDGGTNDAANLVTLCSRCHRFAHERMLAEGAANGSRMALAPAQVGGSGQEPSVERPLGR
ncbi:MAG: HNH endonuclease [bacterium]|nr:HNH endonuclease [bacterium]